MANTSTDRTVYGIIESGKGRRRKQQNPLCSGTAAAYDFLKNRQQPKFRRSTVFSDISPDMETDFFASMKNLTEYYHLDPINVAGLEYPYNVQAAFAELVSQLKNRTEEKPRIVTKEKRLLLAVEQFYSTGRTLFYIPVLPLFRLVRQPGDRPLAELLLSVFCYLYHHAGVPYYREGSYLGQYYELVEEWHREEFRYTEEAEEAADYFEKFNQIRAAKGYGDIILRKIRNKIHLEKFEQRIAGFTPADETESNLLSVAQTAFLLYRTFPNHSFDHSVEPIESDENDVIRSDAYVSFSATDYGWLSDYVDELLNGDLNECTDIDLPRSLVLFDRPDPLTDNFPFEKQLFPMIAKLSSSLNDLS
jgi:hypothetical protein